MDCCLNGDGAVVFQEEVWLRDTRTRIPSICETTIGVSAEINSPAVTTSTSWSPNLPFPLGRSIVTAVPFAPSEIGRPVTNSRGALKDGPEGLAVSKAKRRYKLVR